jgi:hypothetical protein
MKLLWKYCFVFLPFQFGYIKRMEYIQEMTIITIRTWRLV